jgi:Na+-driven multidrug efflux pump
MGLQMIVISVSAVLMITLVNRYGTDTVAAYGAAMQLWNYIQMPAFAIGMAVSAMAAQNIGAERWDRVSRVAKVGVVYNFLLTGVLVLLVELASGHALGVFLPRGSAALGIAEHINLIVAWSFIFFGVTFVIFGVVRSTGAVIVPLAILFVSLIAVRYGAAWLGVDRFESDAIWWSFTVSSVVAVVLSLVYYKFGAWRSSRMTPLAAPRT